MKRERAFLLPCPFCGGESDLERHNFGIGSMGAEPDTLFIYCTTCGASTKRRFDAREYVFVEVVADWNRRLE